MYDNAIGQVCTKVLKFGGDQWRERPRRRAEVCERVCVCERTAGSGVLLCVCTGEVIGRPISIKYVTPRNYHH